MGSGVIESPGALRALVFEIIQLSCDSIIELLDIESALCHVIGVQFNKKLPLAFAQNVLGRANFALINPPFCADNFLTDTR